MSLCAGCGAVIVVDTEGGGLCVTCEAALVGGGCGWPAAAETRAVDGAAAGEGDHGQR